MIYIVRSHLAAGLGAAALTVFTASAWPAHTSGYSITVPIEDAAPMNDRAAEKQAVTLARHASAAVERKHQAAGKPQHKASDYAYAQKDLYPKNHDELLVALTVWGENRAGGPEAMRSVAYVIRNRVLATRDFKPSAKRKHSKFGRGWDGVTQKGKQFSCWLPGDPNRQAMRNIPRLLVASRDYRMWLAAKAVAHEVVSGLRDPMRVPAAKPTLSNALYYHTTAVKPVWRKGLRQTAVISGQIFYADPVRRPKAPVRKAA